MNQEQVVIFSILASILALFAWGRIRYDVVAFMGLILCVLLGLISLGVGVGCGGSFIRQSPKSHA